jgi:protein-disulfide isomerase
MIEHRERLMKELEQLDKARRAGILDDKEYNKGKERIDRKLIDIDAQIKRGEESNRVVSEILDGKDEKAGRPGISLREHNAQSTSPAVEVVDITEHPEDAPGAEKEKERKEHVSEEDSDDDYGIIIDKIDWQSVKKENDRESSDNGEEKDVPADAWKDKEEKEEEDREEQHSRKAQKDEDDDDKSRQEEDYDDDNGDDESDDDAEISSRKNAAAISASAEKIQAHLKQKNMQTKHALNQKQNGNGHHNSHEHGKDARAEHSHAKKQDDSEYEEEDKDSGILRPAIAMILLILVILGVFALFKYVPYFSAGKEAATNETTEEPLFNTITAKNLSLAVEGVTIQIDAYTDFACPPCRQTHDILKQLSDEYDGRIELRYKHFPLNTNNINADVASECAKEQGRFNEYADVLFSKPASEISGIDALSEYAKELKLNMIQFKSCLGDGSNSTKISAVLSERSEGVSKGVIGTPTVFINGKKVEGFKSYAELKAIIEQELA